jgi:hypothetical protein
MIWALIGTGTAGLVVVLVYMYRLSKAKHTITKEKNRADSAEKELAQTKEKLEAAEKKMADDKARNTKLRAAHQKDIEELQEMLNRCEAPDVVVARLNRLGKTVDVLED